MQAFRPYRPFSFHFALLIAYAQKKYHPRQFNVRNGTRKCASRDAVVLWTTLPLAVASTEMPIETSNPAHPESPRAFYISLLNIILCYKNAHNTFVYRALRAIYNFMVFYNKM